MIVGAHTSSRRTLAPRRDVAFCNGLVTRQGPARFRFIYDLIQEEL